MGVISFMFEIVLDLLVFVVVDGYVKVCLQKLNDPIKRQRLWLFEGLGLLLLCCPLISLHHSPYFLILLAGATLVKTQLPPLIPLLATVAPSVNALELPRLPAPREAVRQAWTALSGHWDNYLQHEDNMKNIARQQQLQQQALGLGHLPPLR